MAREPSTLEAESNRTFAERNSKYLKILANEKPPYPLWSLLTVIGFLGWVTCAVLFIIKGISKSGQIKTRQAVFWTGGFVLSFGLWMLSMTKV